MYGLIVSVIYYRTGFYNLEGPVSLSVTPLTFIFATICLFVMLGFTWVLFVTHTAVARDDIFLICCISVFSFIIFFFSDFICIFIVLEIITVIFYVLASLHNNYSTEASLKYALFSLFSSCFLLLSALLIYADVGILNILRWRSCDFSFLGEFGLVLLAISLLFKAGSYPFHNWSLDVYMRSSDFAFFLYSVFTKLFIVSVFVNIFSFLALPPYGYFLLYTFGIGNFLTGILGAFYDRKVRNFIAYTGLVSLGYFLIGYTLGLDGWFLALFYVFAYAITLLFFFFIIYSFSAAMFYRSRGDRPWLRKIHDFAGMLKIDILLSSSLYVCLFSFIGLPPCLGFFAKLFLLFNLYDNGQGFSAFILLVLGVISSFYYLRFIRYISSSEKNVLFGRKNNITFLQKITTIVFLILQLIPVVCFLEITYFFTLLM